MELVKYIFGKRLVATISVSIDEDDFSSKVGTNLENFGYIQIRNLKTNDKRGELFWDNLDFFLNEPLNVIKEECKEEMDYVLYYEKKLLKEIKKHLKFMKSKGYLK